MSRKPLCRTMRLAAAGGWLVLVVALIALPLGAFAWLDALDYERCGKRLVQPPAALLRLRAEHKHASPASIYWQQQQRGRSRTIRGDYGDYEGGAEEYDDDDDDWSHSGERISVGHETYAGEFPWFVLVTTKYVEGRHRKSCGGVILHPNLILTAAHCLMLAKNTPASEVSVQAGVHNLKRLESAQIVAGKRWIVDGAFDFNDDLENFQLHLHDTGLVELARPLEYNQFVQPACLPPEGSKPAPNERCTLAGMGLTDGERPSEKLLALPLQSCARNFPVHPGQSCYLTADPERLPGHACEGDSGGALMCANVTDLGDRARFFATGLGSWSPPAPCEAGRVVQLYFSDMRQELARMLGLVEKLIKAGGAYRYKQKS